MSSRRFLNGQYSLRLSHTQLYCHATVISYCLFLKWNILQWCLVWYVTLLQLFVHLLRFYLLLSETATNCLRWSKFNSLYIEESYVFSVILYICKNIGPGFLYIATISCIELFIFPTNYHSYFFFGFVSIYIKETFSLKKQTILTSMKKLLLYFSKMKTQ